MPSQSVTKKPHEPWVCVHKEKGYIISAHLTCKAGLGEACSHVAALLFKIERASLYGLNKESRTSVTCAWNQFYQKKVTPQPINEIDFNRPKRKVIKKRKKPTADSDEDDLDVSSMFRKLRQIHPLLASN
ncbi:uncharacterized protein LOC132725284 [Ruditapes philippinarum]|uniref:uncharacterized protein LOC132725284 n=1 Tax=Ruditapes philippinarum TaxID=129788 RepID=UPI00295A9F83|nr:uncharacterized protein LOC132725284 [Ruditapes philippinarum]